jgi:protein gp37
MTHGIKRWITLHVARRYRCRSCQSTFYSSDRRWTAAKYGPNLIAYTIYQNIELRIPQRRVGASVNKLFSLDMPFGTVNSFKALMAQTYQHTYDDLLKKLCSGRLLHVDETSISVMGNGSYVWVFTSVEPDTRLAGSTMPRPETGIELDSHAHIRGHLIAPALEG